MRQRKALPLVVYLLCIVLVAAGLVIAVLRSLSSIIVIGSLGLIAMLTGLIIIIRAYKK